VQAHKFVEIAEVAAMDVGEEAPAIAIPEKQKWLKEHPYVPIPTLPHVVAKYPHPPSAFKATLNEIVDVCFLPYMATVLPYLLPFFFSTLVFKASLTLDQHPLQS
jgi:hypothetical protein